MALIKRVSCNHEFHENCWRIRKDGSEFSTQRTEQNRTCIASYVIYEMQHGRLSSSSMAVWRPPPTEGSIMVGKEHVKERNGKGWRRHGSQGWTMDTICGCRCGPPQSSGHAGDYKHRHDSQDFKIVQNECRWPWRWLGRLVDPDIVVEMVGCWCNVLWSA